MKPVMVSTAPAKVASPRAGDVAGGLVTGPVMPVKLRMRAESFTGNSLRITNARSMGYCSGVGLNADQQPLQAGPRAFHPPSHTNSAPGIGARASIGWMAVSRLVEVDARSEPSRGIEANVWNAA